VGDGVIKRCPGACVRIFRDWLNSIYLIMKSFYILISVILLLASCSKAKTNAEKEKKLRGESIEIAVQFISARFADPKVTTSNNGIITITDDKVDFILKNDNNKIKYIIDPLQITSGLIDEDEESDALITIGSSKGQYEQTNEILILISKDGKLQLNRAIESDMKILQLKDRLITAEISTKSRNSPLRDCMKCKEIVKYRFRDGDLIRSE
jgi:hypothetical protein